MRQLLLPVALLAFASCGREGAGPAPGPASTGASARGAPTTTGATVSPVISRAEQLPTALGKAVAIRGTAQDAKLAAVLLVGESVVYCLGLDSWPAGFAGKEVTARGTLESTDQFVARPGPRGEINQGTDGSVLVLRDCRLEGP